MEERVKQYLAGGISVQDDVATKNRELFAVDANKTVPLSKNWSRIINIGKIDALLDSDMQQQLLVMKEEIGFSYVRIWNIFVQDMYDEGEDGNWRYNFSRVDRGLDFLVDNGLKPYIELSFKPMDVSYSINSAMTSKDNEIIFHDRESYQSHA